MANTWVLILGAIATLITALGGASIVGAIARRRPTRVEAVVNLNESTFAWAERIERASAEARAGFAADREQFRADLAEARQQAREAREEIRALRDDLGLCRSEVRKLQKATAALTDLAAAIRKPGATVKGLRDRLDDADLPPGIDPT